MKIVFLGAGAFGLPSLAALAASGHEVVGVISQPDRPAGRGGKMTATPVAAWAEGRGMKVLKTEDVNAAEALTAVRGMGAECLVVIAFGQKLSDEFLRVAKFGGINLHSSLLPKYRGAAPINWAVINGDAEAGVSVIEVTNVMDGGDILAEARTAVGEAETAGELHDRLAALGAPLLPRVLDELAAGTVRRVKQDVTLKSKAPKLSREIAWVDFSRPAAEVSARIRGLSPWPGVQVELTDAAGKVRGAVTLLKCRAVGSTPHGAEQCGVVAKDRTVTCGAGAIEVITVLPAGKKAMGLAAFANGYGFGEGARVRSVVAPGK